MAASMHEQKRDLFQRHFLLGKLELGEIDTLVTRARVASYRAGQEVFAKGSPGRTMIAVLQGDIKIVSLSPTGKEIVLNVIHAGEVFGEIAVIDGEGRSAGAAAMTDCELLIIDRRDVLPMFERHPEICMMLMQILCRRLRRTSEQVEDVLFRSLEARVAKALLQLMEDAKHAEPRDLEVVLHLSQNDLAMIAGCRRESVNKLLQAWQREGWIALGRGSIVIRDAAALERLV
jgi:CRP/FNR family transcriptional regulator, cyclic AMP receptor protein